MTSQNIPLNISWSTTSIKITGVSFGSDSAVKTTWNNIVQSTTKVLDLWKRRHLSLIGKVLVVNTIVFPKFYFVAPVYPILDWVIKETFKAVFSFIWGENKPNLVARKVVVLDKDKGGLGLDDLKIKMDALFVKPFFSLLQTDGEIPLSLTLARYFMAKPLRRFFPHLWSNVIPNSDCCPKPLLNACHIIKDLVDLNYSFSRFVSTKTVVNILRKTDVSISVIRHNPTFPWDEI